MPITRVVTYRLLTTVTIMYSKTLVVVAVVCFFSGTTNGQTDNKFFREDYTYIEKSKSFYKIHTKPQTWANAKRACAQEGASLFYPENSDEVDAVISFWNRTQPDYIRVYVGMSELFVRGVFETIDGKQLSEVFNKWVPGEPNHLGGVEHCVNLYKEHGAINDCPCDILDPFICKKSLQPQEKKNERNLSNLGGQGVSKFFRKDYTYIEASQGFYKIHTTPRTWNDARRLCAQEGASLFYPENSDEVNAVISFWNRTQPTYIRLYVGMSELMVTGVFETIDGKMLSEVFNKWMSGEPSHSGGVEHCVNLYKEHGAINDCPCDILDPFICKKSLQSLEWNYQCNMPYLDYYPGEGTNKCYKLHTTPLTWIEAYNMCRIEESSLAMINNQLEADFLANFTEYTQKPRIKWNYQRGIYHLGFHNRYNDGWQTVKGTPINLEADAWWDDYQPEAGDPDDCGAMFYTGRLINIGCDTKSFFICEHDVDYSNLPQEENLFQ